MRILDYGNESFVQIFKKYYKEGSKSIWDILTIYDIDLINVDPFDEKLDTLFKEKIKYEVSINPWYFLRKCIKLPEPYSDNYPLTLTNHTYLLVDSIINKRTSYHSSIRMSMKTMTIAALARYFRIIDNRDTIFGINNKENANLFENRISSFIVPSYLEDNEFKNVSACCNILESINEETELVALDEFEFSPTPKETHKALLKSVSVVATSTINSNLREEDELYIKDIYYNYIPLLSPDQNDKHAKYRSTFKGTDIKTKEELEQLTKVLTPYTIDHPDLKTRND